MSRFWSDLVHSLEPYAPGEQPRMAGLVKLNTNESPFGPSPRVLEAIRVEAADTLRLYPDPEATALRQVLSTYHGVKPEQVFVGNGSDEVLAHTFAALLKHKAPLLFPDITYSFYPVYCRLFGIAYETVPLDDGMRNPHRGLPPPFRGCDPAQSECPHGHCASADGDRRAVEPAS